MAADTNLRRILDSPKRKQRWAGVLLLLLCGALYFATLDTGLQPGELHGGDLITHQYAQVQARPSNAPGYPLYTMGGWLWFHGLRAVRQVLGQQLPNPMPLLSSYSMLWALAAIGLFYAIICRLTRSERWPVGNWPLAWLLAAFYAVTYFFWYYATTTEQYSSAIAQTLAIVYVYLLWRDAAKLSIVKPSIAPRPSPPAPRLLFLLAFLCGLSLAHMLTVAFIVPSLVLVVLWQRPDLLRSPKAIVGSVIASALPLVSYAFIYVRGAAHPEWRGEGDWASAQDWFWAFVGTAQGREELGWGFEPGRAFLGNGFPELIWQELSIPLLMLGLFGILFYDRKLVTLLYATIGITLLFSWAYRYGNWFQVILPIYPLILLGDSAIADRWMRHWEKRQDNNGQLSMVNVPWSMVWAIPLLLLVVAIGWRLTASLPAADSRGRIEDTALDRAAVLLDQYLPEGAALFATVDDALALQYLTDVWRIQPSHPVVSSEEAGQHLARGLPILATQNAAPILRNELPTSLQSKTSILSPDWVVLQTGNVFEAVQSLKLVPVEGGEIGDVILAEYAVPASPQGTPILSLQPPAVDLMLRWHLASGWPQGLAISIRPTRDGAFIPDPRGEDGAILQQDVTMPVLGLIDAEALAANQSVLDAYRIPFPDGADGITVVLYRQTDNGFENLAEIRLAVED